MTRIEVQLTPQMERFISAKVQSGDFSSPQEVIEAALEQLQARESGDLSGHELNQLIALGRAQANAGELVDGTSVFDEIRQLSQKRRAGNA